MKQKTLAWIAASLVGLLLIYFKLIFLQPQSFTPGEFSAHPLVILMLCAGLGWIKRDEILDRMDTGGIFAEREYMAVGGIVAVIALLMPLSHDPVFALFNILLIFVGLFFVFFGAAAYLPALLTFVYGFSVSFPKVLDELAGTQYALVTTRITAEIAGLVYPVGYEGQLISIINSQGLRKLVFIDAECSGSASLAIFLTIFALMMIDLKPRRDRILPLFIFGILGTSVQNILRLVVLLAANYHFGESVMWQMHSYAGYILFPAWFILFVYVYLKTGIDPDRLDPSGRYEVSDHMKT